MTSISSEAVSVLVVDAQPVSRQLLADALLLAGYKVTALECAEELVEQSASSFWDAAILDGDLPGENGLSLVARLSYICPVLRIILLTSQNVSHDRVRGYAAGADICLSRPVAPAELLAALEALIRRVRVNFSPIGNSTQHWSLVAAARRLVGSGGNKLALSEAETKLLRALIIAPGHRVEYWQLISLLGWDEEERGKQRLEVLTSRLRQKLRDHLPDSGAIVTVRGEGLRLCMPILLA